MWQRRSPPKQGGMIRLCRACGSTSSLSWTQLCMRGYLVCRVPTEVIHNKCDLLHFRVFIRILEVHDFNPPNSSEEDGEPSDEDSSEEYPGYVPGPGILRPWPRVCMLIANVGPSGDPWPALPTAGRGVVWSATSSRCGCRRGRARRRQVPVVQPTLCGVHAILTKRAASQHAAGRRGGPGHRCAPYFARS
jgi:hypothetical protein